MYGNGQIVMDLDIQMPVAVGSGDSSFAWNNVPKHSREFRVTRIGKEEGIGQTKYRRTYLNDIYCPKSIDEAHDYLKKGYIAVGSVPLYMREKITLRLRYIIFGLLWKAGYGTVRIAQKIRSRDMSNWDFN